VHASPCRSLTSTRRVLQEHCIASLLTLSIVTNCLVTIILTLGTQGYTAKRHRLSYWIKKSYRRHPRQTKPALPIYPGKKTINTGSPGIDVF
jgi:hypothetical protein